MGGIADFIVAMLDLLSSGATGDAQSDLLRSPAEYNTDLYNASVLIHNTAVKPVTSMVIAIIASLMLATNSTRIEGDRELGTRIIAATMFKIAMVFITCQNAVLILNAIAGISTWMSTTINSMQIGDVGGATEEGLGEQMRAAIEASDDPTRLVMVIVLILPWIVAMLASVVAVVLIFIRFLQMYLMGAFASLPVAFLGHEDTKSIGIGYLKRYAVVALAGTVIVLAVKLYQVLLTGWLSGQVSYDGGAPLDFLASNFGSFFVAPIVLIFLLLTANSTAKAIVGEG